MMIKRWRRMRSSSRRRRRGKKVGNKRNCTLAQIPWLSYSLSVFHFCISTERKVKQSNSLMNITDKTQSTEWYCMFDVLFTCNCWWEPLNSFSR